ncbi:hypothetical protein H7R52_02595 [Weissella confusa]|uniref:Carbohydrate kinase FGGY N-terminal domain-containing protein n=1 Tax=Weissella confusa TaxID=1583 RepID=A0A923NF29_WEICO|nr:hypothetical protein [Weissella confusa]
MRCPAVRCEAYTNAAHFMGVLEYVTYRLFGLNIVDEALAARTGYYNVAHKTWDVQALAVTGLTAEQLPEIVADSANGWFAMDENFTPLTDVVSGGDNRAAKYVDALMINGIGGQLQRKTGLPMTATEPLVLTLWMKNERHDVVATLIDENQNQKVMHFPYEGMAFPTDPVTPDNIVNTLVDALASMRADLPGEYDEIVEVRFATGK